MPNRRSFGKPVTQIRARDADRAAVLDALGTAYADGQLTDVEHRNRVEAARSARTLDDLDRLVRDLQAPPALSDTVAPSPPPQSTRWIVALAAAVVLVCGIVVVTSARDDDGPTSTSRAAASELTTVAGFGRMLDEIHQELGDSKVDSLTVYPDYASISRPVPGKPGSEQSFQYEDGQLTDNGTSPGRTEGEPVDLAELRPNVPRVIGLLHGADRTLRVDDPTRIYLAAKRGDDGPVVSIHLWNDDTGARGFLTVGFDGAVREVYRADQ